MHRKGPIIAFVHNIPMTMHWKGLWALFRYHGEVIDAFIPVKKSKSGKRFGFVRYNSMMDARRAISRLNNYVILGNKLSEFGRIEVGESSLRSNYDPNKKDEEVVKVKNTNIVVQGHVEEEQLWNLQRCLVDEELFEVLKQNDWVYLREFFIKIELWSETTMVEERDSVRDWDDTVVSESKSAMSPGLELNPNSSQNIYRLDEEMISGIRIETRVGERAKNGYNNRARKEVSNMGLTIDELGLKNEEGAQEEQQISEEGMGLA
ncbi:hypothetical protein Goarm_003536, partial [Gossypium armourianum]|nr:hypothetical protein [Gossypium armourianum]